MSVSRSVRLLALAAALVTPAVFAAEKPADAKNGKDIFEQRCGICHATSNEGGPVIGPSMVGLVGRKAGSQKDFPMYTEAMKSYGVKWSAKTLDAFLVNPVDIVSGTTMPMSLPDDKERADVIAYLATLK